MMSRIIGKIESDEFDLDLYYGEEKEIPYFDNRTLPIGIYALGDEEILENADLVLENFLGLNLGQRDQDAELVMQNYKLSLELGLTQSLRVEKVKDIWNFVFPVEIIIDSIENEGYFVYVLCGCAWEVEHGLQLTYKTGLELIKAGAYE